MRSTFSPATIRRKPQHRVAPTPGQSYLTRSSRPSVIVAYVATAVIVERDDPAATELRQEMRIEPGTPP